MGFEDYTVSVEPWGVSSLYANNDEQSLLAFCEEICAVFPNIKEDEVEIQCLQYKRRKDQVFLYSETEAGLFQILVNLVQRQYGRITVSVRFAYCNSRTVYDPYCTFIEWLMTEYDMMCLMMRDLSPSQKRFGRIIIDVKSVRQTLVPSMDFHRQLWQDDFGSVEIALRPGDAVAYFVSPFLTSLSL